MHDVLCADRYFARANFLTLTIYPKTICSSCISSNEASRLESMSIQQTLHLKIYDFALSSIKSSKIGGSAVLQPKTIVLKSIVITSLENCRYHS